MISAPECPKVYTGTFHDQPLKYDLYRVLFEEELKKLFDDLQDLPRNAALRKLNDFIKRARHWQTLLYLLYVDFWHYYWMIQTIKHFCIRIQWENIICCVNFLTTHRFKIYIIEVHLLNYYFESNLSYINNAIIDKQSSMN